MSEIELQSKKNNEESNIIEEILDFIYFLLTKPILPEHLEIADHLQGYKNFDEIVRLIIDLRELSSALNKGDLNKFVYSKGYIISNLKALQSNLRHLTWQTKKIAEGDFTQKVDFLGDFSVSFNEMTAKIEDFSLELTKMANIDTLTQIPNRLSLTQFLTNAFERFSENQEPFSVLMMDIDFFKKVNDTYGHDVGDKVLIQVSEKIKVKFRSTDIFARYGGEEFIAVLTNIEPEIALKTAKRVLRDMNESPLTIQEDIILPITVSIGISQAQPEDQEYNDVVLRSDKALYIAKEKGRNQIAIYTNNEIHSYTASD